MKKISVHIVTYNSAEFIGDCIQSVLGQSYPVSQIIVVDNNSRDNSLDILSAFNKQIELYRNPINKGFAGGHNQAISHSNADYYLVLNPDVILGPDYVKHIVSFLEMREDVGSCTGRLLSRPSPDIIDSTGLIIRKNRRAFDRGMGDLSVDWEKSSEVFGVSGAAAVYTRKMVEDLSFQGQFFDESFFAYKEDVDVAWRARLLGWKSFYIAEAVAYHERGWKKGKRTEKSLMIRRHSYINRYRMIVKNDSWKFVGKHLPFILPYELASLAILLLREPLVLSAWVQFIKDWEQLKHWRKAIQKKRKDKDREVYRFFV
jgi:GT2 family glycosyltransferase